MASVAAVRRIIRAAFIRVAKSKAESASICLVRAETGASCAGAPTAARSSRKTDPISRSATASARNRILLQLRIELQGQLQVGGFVARELHRIDAGVTRRAVLRAPALDAR